MKPRRQLPSLRQTHHVALTHRQLPDLRLTPHKLDARLAKWTDASPILAIGGLIAGGAIYLAYGRASLAPPLLISTWTLAAIGYLTTKVRLAGDEVPDQPEEDIPVGPPPLEPHFRGGGGPSTGRRD